MQNETLTFLYEQFLQTARKHLLHFYFLQKSLKNIIKI